jgi:phospholipid/cholesterol/gamma-HCH transport system substrate-binding protein
MDRDANYVAVGAFVLLVCAMAVSFVFWYTEHQDKRSYQRYEIYFQGTVSGLTEGSPVRYLGVDVGKVVRITLDPAQPKRVQVTADIDLSAPIDGRTLASLSLQGITGLLYIDLQQEKTAGEPGPLAQGRAYPVIRSAPSDFDVLISSLPALATHATQLVDHLDQILSEDNLRAVHATLANLKTASEHLPATLRATQDMLTDMQRAVHEIEGAAADLHSLETRAAPQLDATLSNVRHATESLARTSDQLDRFVAANQPSLSQFTSQSLPEFERLLRESRAAARDFQELTRSLKQNPSQLLYEPSYRGVQVPQ